MNNNKIEKNGIITFKYSIYEKNGNWITTSDPITMVVGSDTVLPGLSDAIIGLDYTIKNQTIDFRFFRNKNDQNYDLVDLDLEIFSYNDFENIEENTEEFKDSFVKKNNKDSKNNKKEINELKKEINELKKEIKDLETKINNLNTNEALLNKKIIEISENAQKHINEFKESHKKQFELKLQEAKDFQFQSFFENFLGPLNNLYMAVEFGAKSNDNPELVGYVKGFELLINQMFSVLDSFGVSSIEPNIGDEFDPSLHNIIELVKNSDFKKDKIVELRNRGYKLNGRVIMPANVLVSKK